MGVQFAHWTFSLVRHILRIVRFRRKFFFPSPYAHDKSIPTTNFLGKFLLEISGKTLA